MSPRSRPKVLSSDNLAIFVAQLVGENIIHTSPSTSSTWREKHSSSTLSPSTSWSKHQKTWLDEQLHMVYSSKSKWAFYSLCPKLQSHSISLQAFRSLCRSTLQALHSTRRTVKRRSELQRTEKVQTAEPLQIFYSLLQDWRTPNCRSTPFYFVGPKGSNTAEDWKVQAAEPSAGL